MDLTNIEDVKELMESSGSEHEWKENCAKVKLANGGGYPKEWYATIILGGVLSDAKANWIIAELFGAN